MSSSKRDQQSSPLGSSDENNRTLFNSDPLSQRPTNLRHSIASSEPSLEKSNRSTPSSHVSPANFSNDSSKKNGTGGDEMKTTTSVTSRTDNQIPPCRTFSETSSLEIQSLQPASKSIVRASKSHDPSARHRSTTPNTPPSTPQIQPRAKPELQVFSSDLSTSKKNNDSDRLSISTHPNPIEHKQTKTESTISPSDIRRRSPYDQMSSPTDDQSSSSNQDYHQSQKTVIRQTQSIKHEDQTRDQSQTLNLSPRSTPKASNRDYPIFAYVSALPCNDFNNKELESMITDCLRREYQLQIIDIKCSLQLDVGIVYLRNNEDKYRLINTIKSIKINSKSNETISFVDELEIISYVVIEPKDIKYLPVADDIRQQWMKVYNGNCPLTCKNLCDEFPNIFRVVINTCDELINTTLITEFLIGKQKAIVYFRADCCFFEYLSRTFSEDNLKSAISKQISERNISNKSIYIQYNKAEANAIVITCDKARRWALFRSINLDGQFIMKIDKIIYRLIIRSVPRKISVSRIENLEIFAGTRTKAIPYGDDIILELRNKSIYDKCLKQGFLNIDDHNIKIDTYSLANNYEDLEIDARNWYETEMCVYKSDIMQFIAQPEHPIFQFKWNPKAFIEQFNRWTLKTSNGTTHERDHSGTISNEQRHLLRMTVMLNTIGILKKGSYHVDDKKIKLKSDPLKTIVYNHQSKLQHGMTKQSSSAIDYPYTTTSVHVVNEDCLIVYEYLLSKGYRPLLLNMANAHSPGGGYRRGDGAQEENIFRRSNYFRSLDMDLDDRTPTARFYCTSNCEEKPLTGRDRMYPMDEFGAIYTSGLTVFRQPENIGYALMDKPMLNVCAIAIAAYRDPKLDKNNKNFLSSKYSIGMRKKIENIFAIGHHHNHDCLVLSAFGCGAFRNPPKHVAAIFKSVIEQYAGFFNRIYFAIIDDHNAGQEFNPHGNFRPFQEIFNTLEFKPIRQKMVDMMIGPWRILNETNNREITLNDIRIHYLPPCRYGGRCRDLENKQHCREYLHPPICPYMANSKDCELKDDNDHMLWYKHLMKCSRGAKCQLNENPTNLNQFEHPKINRDNRQYADMNREHLKLNRNISAGDDKSMSTEYDVYNKNNHSVLQTCPFTPFHCRQHTLLSEATNIQTVSLDARNHCADFLHVCRFGRQCYDTSKLHLEKTIHIARDMCRYGKKCLKIHQEDHLNSFSHEGIPDIRRLCMSSAYECPDLQKPEHIIRYRHSGNYDRSSIIQYGGLNKRINFVQNQRIMFDTILDYAQNLPSKAPLSISNSISKYIRGLLPVYQCSKEIFELILIHGHVMSHKRIDELQMPKFLIENIQRNKKIESIITQYKNQSLEDHIKDYIKAIVSNVYSKRTPQTKPTVTNTRTNYSQLSTMPIPDEDFNNTIRKEEKFLRDKLNPTDIDIIRRYTTEITEATFNLEINSNSIRKTSDEICDEDKYIYTILGPQLRRDYGDIVLVFKRQVMLHPDANFSIQSEASFLNGTTFNRRPWVTDSRTSNERIKQFQESKLHCSILGYESSAAAELIAAAGQHKKTIDVDSKSIINYLTSVDTDSLFEGHLPDLIPLDYIEEIYIPKNLFTSLSPAAQKSAKSIFHCSCYITNHEINLNSTPSRESRVLEKNRTEYQQYVMDKLNEKFVQNIGYASELRGTCITLPPSCFIEYVALPFTISQIYGQYLRNKKQDPISNEIYIYFQAMYGDVMITLSNERIGSVQSRRYIPCLMCYVADIPSTTSSDYQESISYLNYGDPFQHKSIMDKCLFVAHSNKFHRNCNVDDFLNYCLKLEKSTGQVTLSHAGPNSIYNYETISYKFPKSTLDLSDLNYIHVSAGSHQVPIRNMMVCFHQVPDLHPLFDRNFKPNRSSPSQQNRPSSARCQSAAAAKSTDDKSQPIFSKIKQFAGSLFAVDKEKLRPCPNSINCLEQTSNDHCKRYSHPCRFAELCRNQDKEPHLTHEPHRVIPCVHDKSCKRLDDPVHRASYRHTGLPDFLVPCRDQKACRNQTGEHRMKYSHGENIERIAAAEKPRKVAQASSLSSENYCEQQHNRHENHNEQIPCRHGSKCRDQTDSQHCSRYSHSSEHRQKSSSSDQDRSRTPCAFGSACYNTSDPDHCSQYSHSDVQRRQPAEMSNHQRVQCPDGNRCRNTDDYHCSRYSHSFK
ncbi:unnamed protein product [Rotaria sp. Silwood1]|nr:unnamed protein product [Rotaria sp. Silwood1]CAF3702456.1 unnamed protein product [Rotaria sp. Silwood1]